MDSINDNGIECRSHRNFYWADRTNIVQANRDASAVPERILRVLGLAGLVGLLALASPFVGPTTLTRDLAIGKLASFAALLVLHLSGPALGELLYRAP